MLAGFRGMSIGSWCATAMWLGGLCAAQACTSEHATSANESPTLEGAAADAPRWAPEQPGLPRRPGMLELATCGSSGDVLPLGFSADGQIVVRDADGVQFIDPVTLEQTRRIEGVGDWALLARGGRHLLTRDGVLDLETGRVTQQGLPQPPDGQLVGLSPSGRWLAFSRGGSVMLWDIDAGNWSDVTFQDGEQVELALASPPAFSKDDRKLALTFAQFDSGTQVDLFVSVFSINGGALLMHLQLRNDDGSMPDVREGLVSLDFAPDDELLVTLPGFGTRLVQTSSSTVVWSSPIGVAVQQAGVVDESRVWYSPADADGGTAIDDESSGARIARLDDVTSARPLHRWPGSRLEAGNEVVTWNPERDLALVRGRSGIWLARPFQPDATPTPVFSSQDGWGGRLAFLSPRVLAEFSSHVLYPILRTVRVPAGTVIAEYAPGETQSEWAGALAVSPDGTLVAAAFPSNVHVLRSHDLSLAAIFPTAAGALAWSPDGSLVATTPDLHYRDSAQIAARPARRPLRAVQEWELASGQQTATYELPDVPVFVSYAQAGDALIAGMMRSPDTGDRDVVAGEASPPILLTGEGQGVQIDRTTHALSSYSVMPIAAEHGFWASATAIAGPGPNTPSVPLAVPLSFAAWGTQPSFSSDGRLIAGVADDTRESGGSERDLVVLWSADGALLARAPSISSNWCALAVSPSHGHVALSRIGGGGSTFLCAREP
jgi:WD40 repeat protein